MQRIRATVVFDIDLGVDGSYEALKAAIRASIQAGLNAKVQGLEVIPISIDIESSQTLDQAPRSKASNDDQTVEEYIHAGMEVSIVRSAGNRVPPRYFGIVVNPNVKYKTGSLTPHSNSYKEAKQLAEARAELKALKLLKKNAAPY